MTDIVERLNDSLSAGYSELRKEAAVEIMRLRSKIEAMERQDCSKQSMPAEVSREFVMDAIAQALGDAYDCTRVWSAWGYGTMSHDDFQLIAEDGDRLREIADAAIMAMGASAPKPCAQPASSMPEVTDAMALAFHRALTDGSIGAREVEEIKDALRAALSATPGSSRDDQHAGGLKVLNHQGLMERARQNAKKEAGLIYPDDDARREEKEQELASEYYRQYTTPNP